MRTHNSIDEFTILDPWVILHNRWKLALAIVAVVVNCGKGTLASSAIVC